MFIDQFGSHFVYDVMMGGRATQEISYNSEAISQMSAIGIDISIAAKAKFANFYMDTSFDWSKHQQ